MRGDIENLENRLLQRRNELLALGKAAEESRRPVELDQASIGRLSRIDAIQVQAMAVEAERRRTLEIQRIEAALRRIEEDEFGYCVSCGEEIAPKRLEFDPTVSTCIDCARARGGGA